MARNDNKERFNKEPKDELIVKTVDIKRVAKVVKGGRNMRFSALVVVGDGQGKVGCAVGKAKEVPEAIKKAEKAATSEMCSIARKGTTIPHEVIGVYGRGKVIMIPAEQGAGVIAGGPVRAVLEACGISDIRTKSIGTNNPVNCVKATVEGLKSLRTVEQVAALRGKKVEEILG
ncbi:MAG: 30S ribosomal protein S5 [Firmicutes bacterium ADurb.Bin080]|jgi:small subunit ribosomal protein S5|nr:MAG: 30S ribosomal protein S5 [Firmicutes bacterium ADurb.Bin080]